MHIANRIWNTAKKRTYSKLLQTVGSSLPVLKNVQGFGNINNKTVSIKFGLTMTHKEMNINDFCYSSFKQVNS